MTSFFWEGRVSLLDAWTSEIKCALQHPESKLYLTGRLFGILAARNHVQRGPAMRVITKDELLSRDRLCKTKKGA